MDKYVFTKLKSHLTTSGVDISTLVQKAKQIDEPSTPGLRTWSSALNKAGVSEKTLGKIRSVVPSALKELGKTCPDTALEVGKVVPKKPDA
ncbi:MAG: hypothetical protein ACK5LJ_10940 [Paracoccus sp. (in: a-proteobacteria)]